MLISVCICTYNRRELLAQCLHSLGRLIDPRPRHDLEILVIDNNSTDDTASLVKGLVPTFPFKIRYVFEAQQGISAARNRAVNEADGDYLGFLDDECIVEPNWLAIAIGDIEAFQPSIIGGPYTGAFLPGDRPRWFRIEYGNAYFLSHEYEKGFQKKFRASSGNMFVRRDVFDSVQFDAAMGPKGNEVKPGEEMDLQERYLGAHPAERVFYEPAISVRHFIRPEKLLLSYRAKHQFAVAMASPITLGHWELLLASSKAIAHLVFAPFACIFRNRAKFPFWQNYAYEKVLPATCVHLGMVAKYFSGPP
jgi:glycosyltransferase involved in cell wall biosynthesis